jgi:hypothetical protein
MYGCSKLYCKSDNLLKIGIKDRKYFFRVRFRDKQIPPNASARQVCR